MIIESKFLALSTPKATFEEAQNRRIQNRRRAEVLDALKLGKECRSDLCLQGENQKKELKIQY